MPQLFNLAETLKDVAAIKAARQQNRIRSNRIEAAQAKAKRQNRLQSLRVKAIRGSERAQKLLVALAPKEAKAFQNAWANMGKAQRQATQRRIEAIGTLAATVLQSETPARTYQQVREQFPEIAKAMPEQYNEAWVQMQLARAIGLDQLTQAPEAVTFGGQRRLYRNGLLVGTTPSNSALNRAQEARQFQQEQAQEARQFRVTHQGGQTVDYENVQRTANGFIGFNPQTGQYERIPMAEDVEIVGNPDFELQASDENAIFDYAASLFGGFYNPATGEFSGLSSEKSQKVLAIATRASQIFAENRGTVTRSSAVAEAARQLGISIPNLSLKDASNLSAKELVEQYGGGE